MSEFFNADNLALMLMESEDSPQYLAVKIADAHDEAIREATTLDECAIAELANEFCRRDIPNGATHGDTLFTIYARRVAQWLMARKSAPYLVRNDSPQGQANSHASRPPHLPEEAG